VIDLASASVFLDFDGTISTRDVCVHLLETTAPDEWHEVEARYERGEIGSRECLVDEWAMVDGSEQELRALAAEVPLDPGFAPLVQALHDGGAEVTVVSDGFGFYVHDACRGIDVDVLTNTIDFARGTLEFPHEDRCCPCTTCGVCKQAPIKDARRRARTTVLVGDGVSDRKAALLADLVFAKGALAWWCDAFDVPYRAFDGLDEVRRALT
jgi:2,3-diketo-5-methylthio-1-phosphopentane phosphatase